MWFVQSIIGRALDEYCTFSSALLFTCSIISIESYCIYVNVGLYRIKLSYINTYFNKNWYWMLNRFYKLFEQCTWWIAEERPMSWSHKTYSKQILGLTFFPTGKVKLKWSGVQLAWNCWVDTFKLGVWGKPNWYFVFS